MRGLKEKTPSDEQLFLNWRDGDLESFELLLERYQARLFRTILAWTKDFQLAEDIFQETWMKVIAHKQDFDSQKKFSSWIFQIALNLVRDSWRKNQRQQKEIELEFVSANPISFHPEQSFEYKERKERLLWALFHLSEAEREVFVLRHFAEMSFAEIADMLGINLNTALGRMHQAVKKLKKLFGEE